MLNAIKGLIGAGKTQDAISQMAKLAAGRDDIYNSLMQLSGRFSQGNFYFAMGLADSKAHQSTAAEVNFGLLALLDQMQLQGLTEPGRREANDEDNTPKSRLLFLASNPVDKRLGVLQLEKEYLEIRKIFKNHRNKFSITEEFDVSLDTFFEAIYREKPQIIHLSGFAEEAGIILTQKTDNSAFFVPYEYLAPAFKMLKDTTEIVFFNTGTSNLFAKVVSRVVPYAIGIRGMVSDAEAISFSSGFYAALALEKNYEKAFNMGLDLLMSSYPPAQETAGEAKAEAPEQKYFLYQNGFCEADTLTPDDFYTQQAPAPQERKKRK